MQPTEELEKLCRNFIEKIADINNFQYFTKNATDKALKNYIEHEKNSNETYQRTGYKSSFMSGNSFFCRDIETGQTKGLASRENNYENIVKNIHIHQNKQYMWLLVEAYEELEKYIDKLYAYIGYIDNNFWIAKDFGNIEINKIKNNDFEWFLDRVSKIGHRPEVIYNRLRKKIPIIDYLEHNNKLDINYKFVIMLISKIRHIIVHNSGIIEDVDKFSDTILKAIGVSKDSETGEKLLSNIYFYIGEIDSTTSIVLLEYRDRKNKQESPIDFYHDRLGNLLSRLTEYAILLSKYVDYYLHGEDNIKKLAVDVDHYKDLINERKSIND